MLTGDIRNQIDAIWNAFWSGGISNPLEVIEQITYLLFLRRLDEMQQLEENQTRRLGKSSDRPPIYPKGLPFEQLRCSRFKNEEARRMFEIVAEHVFPFLCTLGGDGSTYAHHMKDARFTIPTPALLAKVVDLIAKLPMEDRDTKGDLYAYMLGNPYSTFHLSRSNAFSPPKSLPSSDSSPPTAPPSPSSTRSSPPSSTAPSAASCDVPLPATSWKRVGDEVFRPQPRR